MMKLLTCYAKDVRAAGHVSNPLCLPESVLAIASAFAKADSAGVCDGDPDAAAAVMNDGANQITAALAPFGLSLEQVKCAAAKIRAAGKRAFKDLKCFVRAARSGTPVDPACRAAARAKLVTQFAAKERRTDCAMIENADEIELLVARFVVDALAETAAHLIPRLCCQISATVPLVPEPATVEACADVVELGCASQAILLGALGATAVPVPGTVCSGDGLCRSARTATGTCCEVVSNSDPSRRACVEDDSAAFATCDSFNLLQNAATFTPYPGRICVDHTPAPPSCDGP
jgi:hypothetical protein